MRPANRTWPGSDPASADDPLSGVLRIYLDGVCSGPVNMARDRELLRSHRAGEDPVLRIYQWDPPCVTLGYNQDPQSFAGDEVAAAGYDLVQRPTGGRAILHAEELTYAVVGTSPGPLFGDTLHESYMTINRALLAFLSQLGITAEVSAGESRAEARGLVCFHSAGRHEIRTAGRKLIGSAQRRQRGVFLQHGSILAGGRHRELVRFLDLDPTARAKEEADLACGTTDLAAQLGRPLTADDLAAMGEDLARAFAAALGLRPEFMGAWG